MTQTPRLAALALILLTACSPQDVADRAVARAAESVVVPMVDDTMTEAQAEGVARCIVLHASAFERETLARDVGVVAGTRTREVLRSAGVRPAAQACISAGGLPAPVL